MSFPAASSVDTPPDDTIRGELFELLRTGDVNIWDQELPLFEHKFRFFEMKTHANLEAWWNIRQYLLIDLLDERLTMEGNLMWALTGVVVITIWVATKFLEKDRTSPADLVVLYDSICLGLVVIRSCQACVAMNEEFETESTCLAEVERDTLLGAKGDGASDDDYYSRSTHIFRNHLNLLALSDTRQKLLGMPVTQSMMQKLIIFAASSTLSVIAKMHA